uniref:Uncharacterized protein LOC111103657 n=1 Tax=Crassostrea virginica TaxID=6565 RepID=A0A8B8ARG8_CRAVI|nr:uncharacterized protein LOC111103657 [Crassostrea virginica]
MASEKYRCWKRKKENGKKKNKEKETALTTTEEINNQPKGANITTTTTEDNSNQPKETTNTNDVPELSVESNPDDTEAEKLLRNILDDIFTQVNRERTARNYMIAVEEATAMAERVIGYIEIREQRQRRDDLSEWLRSMLVQHTKNGILRESIPCPDGENEFNLITGAYHVDARQFDKSTSVHLQNLYADRDITRMTLPRTASELVEDLLFYNAEERYQRSIVAEQERQEERRSSSRFSRFISRIRNRGNCVPALFRRIWRTLRR